MNRAEILRAKVTKLVPLLTGMDVRVTQSGASAYVEHDKVTLKPIRVNLPYVPDDADDILIDATEGFVDHEVGHCLYTSNDAQALADKAGVLGTWNAVEDVYVERKMTEAFPGSKQNLGQVRNFFINNYTHPNVERALAYGKDPKPFLTVCAYRAWAGQQQFIDYMNDGDKWSLLGDMLAMVGEYCKEKLPHIQNSQEAVLVATEIKRRLKQEKPEPPPMPPQPPEEPEEEPENEPDQKTGGKGETPEEEGEGPSSEPNESEEGDDNGAPSNADEEPDSENEREEPAPNGDTEDEPNEEAQPQESESDSEGSDDEAGEENSSSNGDDDTDSDDEPEGEDSNNKDQSEGEAQPEEAESQSGGDDTENGEQDGEQESSQPEPGDDGDQADESGVSAEQEGEDIENGDGSSGSGGDQNGDEDNDGENSEGDTADGGAGDSESESGGTDGNESDESSEPNKDDTERDLNTDPEMTDADFLPGGGVSEADITLTNAEQEQAINDVEEEQFEPIDFEALDAAMEDFDEAVSEELTKKAFEELDNSQYTVFTKDYDYIGPLTPKMLTGVTDKHVINMTNVVDQMLSPMQKDLERMIAARSAVVWVGGQKKGKLHSGSLTRLIVNNDPRVFRQKLESRSKSVAIEIVCDFSGSMGGTKIKTAAYASYGLLSVLDKMQIPVEMIGFTTTRDEKIMEQFGDDLARETERLKQTLNKSLEYSRYIPLTIPVVKDFNQRMTPEVIRSIAAVADAKWLQFNVDGESVQTGAARLMTRREDRKIMIVLSDGNPSALGSGQRVLEAHLRKVVKDATAAGIEIIGIGIEDDSVRKFYPNHVIINNVTELPSLVMRKMKEFLS